MQRKLIIFTTILFITSSSYLLFLGNRYANTDYQRNWWSLAFSDPKNNNLNFIIENHTDNSKFHYEVFEGKNKVLESDIIVEKGKKKEIDINLDFPENQKVNVLVSDGKEKKEIYKNF